MIIHFIFFLSLIICQFFKFIQKLSSIIAIYYQVLAHMDLLEWIFEFINLV